MENPEITGAEFPQGTLGGYEAREYLLAKWNRACAYCGATNTPLNLDHIHPKAAGGSIWISNLALGRILCSQSKGSQDLTTWLVAKSKRGWRGRSSIESWLSPRPHSRTLTASTSPGGHSIGSYAPPARRSPVARVARPSGTEPDAVCPRPTSSTPYASATDPGWRSLRP